MNLIQKNTIQHITFFLMIFCFSFTQAINVIHQKSVTTQDLMTRAFTHRNYSKTTRSLQQHIIPNKFRRNWGNYWMPNTVSLPENNINDQFMLDEIALFRKPLPLSIGLNFTAATVSNAIDPLIIPPNLNGSVGSEQYILMSYNIIRSFNKSTGLPDEILNLNAASFFGVPANDVRINFDRFSHRWFMSCEETNQKTGNPSNIILAMSDGPVITNCSSWKFFTFSNATIIPQINNPGTGILDYQQLAIDAHNVYISTDTFDKKGNFYGTSTLAIKKTSLTTNSIVASVFHSILPGTIPALASGITPPADNFDTNPNYGYIVNATNNAYPSNNTYTHIFLYRILNPETASPSLGNMITIPVPSYSDSANAPYKGNLFGHSAFLQTGSCNFTAPHVRNHQLYVCHNIQINQSGIGTPNGDRVGVRWYQFDLTGDVTGNGNGIETETTVPALIQYGTFYDSTSTSFPDFYFIPSIMTNQNGDLAIGCTISGDNTYPNAVTAMRNHSDSRGTLSTPIPLTCSCNSYNFGPFVNPSNGNMGQRWGDLTSMSVDPINDLDIWATQEFAAIQNGWGVQVTQLQPNMHNAENLKL